MILIIILSLAIGAAIGYGAAKFQRPDPDRAKLRHDLRGALTPAMLAAEMLESHADPVVQQRSAIVSEAINRAQQIMKQDAARK